MFFFVFNNGLCAATFRYLNTPGPEDYFRGVYIVEGKTKMRDWSLKSYRKVKRVCARVATSSL